ncbi:hypothetical protein D9758_003076 [Tetrapyrgos nigripes]|uniref:Uncharacterized protein n=1 Tax=Tetrapyrgos nigripes TaxID=182062 RepID=A0A8H5GQ09_9AGAR|nr:hypothetical protein D9758_003076 [Tetrapyrgos nigripes]
MTSMWPTWSFFNVDNIWNFSAGASKDTLANLGPSAVETCGQDTTPPSSVAGAVISGFGQHASVGSCFRRRFFELFPTLPPKVYNFIFVYNSRPAPHNMVRAVVTVGGKLHYGGYSI